MTKIEYIANLLNLSLNQVFYCVLKKSSPLLPGAIWKTYYATFHQDEILCYDVKTFGFFTKKYKFEKVYSISFSSLTSAEFYHDQQNLWLHLQFANDHLHFTAGNTWPNAKELVLYLKDKMSISNIELYEF